MTADLRVHQLTVTAAVERNPRLRDLFDSSAEFRAAVTTLPPLTIVLEQTATRTVAPDQVWRIVVGFINGALDQAAYDAEAAAVTRRAATRDATTSGVVSIDDYRDRA